MRERHRERARPGAHTVALPVQGADTALVREYEANDSVDLRQCFLALQEYERSLEPLLPIGKKVVDAYLERTFARCARWDGKIFVAEIDGRVVGYVCIWARVPQQDPDEAGSNYAFISDLVVLPDQRNRGLGSKLLDRAESYAFERGARELRVGVLARNRRAQELYERRGFSPYHVQLIKRSGA